MRRQLQGELRRALRGLRRAPAFALGVAGSLALGVGSGLALLPLLEVSLLPPRLDSAVRAVPPPSATGWWPFWTDAATPPAALQTDGLDDVAALLAALALLALAVALVNALILLAGRVSARRREAAVRSALGASPARLRLGIAVEGAALGVVAGLAAVAVAAAGSLALRVSWPAGLETLAAGPGFVTALALLGVGVPVLAALALSVVPAAVFWRGARLHEPLSAGARASAGPRERAARRGLSGLQVAAALALLTGAGLLLRNAGPLERPASLGYDAAGLLTLSVDLPVEHFPDAASRAEAWARLLQELRAVPEVSAESIATHGALLGLGPMDEQTVFCGACSRGGMPLPAWPGRFVHHAVGPGWFETLGARLLAGRGIEAADGRPGAPAVVVVNRAFVREVMDENVTLGKPILVGGLLDGRAYTIVGIVDDMEARGLGTRSRPRPAAYFPAVRHPPASATLAVRLREPAAGSVGVDATRGASTGAGTDAAAERVRHAVRDALPRAAVGPARPLAAELRAFAAPLRWLAALIGALAGVALLLAGFGIAGNVRQGVALRTREIGTRMALGAGPRDIVGMVLRDGLALAAKGATLGALGAIAVARFLQLLFTGVRLIDPPLLLALAAVLAGTAVLAALPPARAATRVDPIDALRME